MQTKLIYKYAIEVTQIDFTVNMPVFHKFLSIGRDGEDKICMWFEVNSLETKDTFLFTNVMTGHPTELDDRAEYLGSYKIGESIVLHLYKNRRLFKSGPLENLNLPEDYKAKLEQVKEIHSPILSTEQSTSTGSAPPRQSHSIPISREGAENFMIQLLKAELEKVCGKQPDFKEVMAHLLRTEDAHGSTWTWKGDVILRYNKDSDKAETFS